VRSLATLGIIAGMCGCGRLRFDPLATGDGKISDVTSSQIGDAPAVDYCAQVPALGADPIDDGVLEPGLTAIPIVPLWLGPGMVPAGVSARYAVGWRSDRLYIFVDVTDPDRWPAVAGEQPYCGDAVELFVDSDGMYPSVPMYDNPGTRQMVIVAPADDVDPVARAIIGHDGQTIGAWSGTFHAYPRSGGYLVEAIVEAADLGLASWTLAGHVGVDVGVDVSTPDGGPGNGLSSCTTNGGLGHRLGQFALQLTTPTGSCTNGDPYCDVRAFCNPILAP